MSKDKSPHARVQSEFPRSSYDVLTLGVARLVDYQDETYAGLYLNRLKTIMASDDEPYPLLIGTGRQLALWMCYVDSIRVAQLKSRPKRLADGENGVTAQEPVVVVDYLRRGIEESAAIMPAWLGWRLMGWAKKTGKLDAYNAGMRVKTASVRGWLLVKILVRLRRWRPHTYRFEMEQRGIERWLRAVRSAAQRDAGLALEIVECARLANGYGDARRLGMARLQEILTTLVDNPKTRDPREQAATIRKAREAALADPDGTKGRPTQYRQD